MFETTNNKLDDKLYSIEQHLSYPVYSKYRNIDSSRLCNSQKKTKI